MSNKKRIIKFRAWDKKSKWMLRSFDNWIDFDGDFWEAPYTTYNTPNQEIVRVNNIILMQFTGILDKNKQEIYEGDIIKVSSGNWSGNWEVIYSSGAAKFCIKGRVMGTYGKLITKIWAIPKHGEIIGNIYENPELLEKKRHD